MTTSKPDLVFFLNGGYGRAKADHHQDHVDVSVSAGGGGVHAHLTLSLSPLEARKLADQLVAAGDDVNERQAS